MSALDHESVVTLLHHHIWLCIWSYCIAQSIFGGPRIVVNR